MTRPPAPSALQAPIQRIVFADEIVRLRATNFRSSSTPGHLLHIVESGEVRQEAEGRPVTFREGHVIWYHEAEPVAGRILRAPWRFITIHFYAPDLPPPPDDRRVMRAGPHTRSLARRLLRHWRDRTMPPLERSLRCFETLSALLLDFLPLSDAPDPVEVYPSNARDRWWRVEKQLRLRLDQPVDLRAIADLAGMSVRTTVRACKAATGMPPCRRLKDLRLSYAVNLLQHSTLTMTEISMRVGYARVQEFSRDIKDSHGLTPRALRATPPGYRTLRS